MSQQSALYSQKQAALANLNLQRLGIKSWEEDDVKALQTKLGITPVDGWFGPKSIEVWKTWARTNDSNPVSHTGQAIQPGQAILKGVGVTPPAGLKIVNFVEAGGIPAQMDDTDLRKHDVYQFIIHQGAESHVKGENYAQATERVLDARGLSTTFSMDIDGVIYQHFDPAIRRGRHCTYHNVQSDSLDIGGPFDIKHHPEPGQVQLTLNMAIGREDDHKPPLSRAYGTVKCWSMTQMQIDALALFLPWWCNLRGIPATACGDWRTFRLSGDSGVNDPVTKVKGILAHTNVSEPGRRVDGILPLHHLQQMKAPGITWRTGADFFK